MVLGHGFRAIGRIVKGLWHTSRVGTLPIVVRPSVSSSFSKGKETNRTKRIVLKTDHFSRPVDCDFFGHMNNSFYFRHAELARWQLLPQTGILQLAIKYRWMFLVVQQSAEYLKPLPPLTKFHVRTTATTDVNDKYLWFHHDFVSTTDENDVYCTAKVKAIVKHFGGDQAGKTVRPSQMNQLTKENWLSSSCSSSIDAQ